MLETISVTIAKHVQRVGNSGRNTLFAMIESLYKLGLMVTEQWGLLFRLLIHPNGKIFLDQLFWVLNFSLHKYSLRFGLMLTLKIALYVQQ